MDHFSVNDPVDTKKFDKNFTDEPENFFAGNNSLQIVLKNEQKVSEASYTANSTLWGADEGNEIPKGDFESLKEWFQIRQSQRGCREWNDGLAIIYGDIFSITALAFILFLRGSGLDLRSKGFRDFLSNNDGSDVGRDWLDETKPFL